MGTNPKFKRMLPLLIGRLGIVHNYNSQKNMQFKCKKILSVFISLKVQTVYAY